MRSRIEKLLNFSIRGMWIGTFHGLANRLLRIHWSEAGLPRTFEVIDSSDQLRLVKQIVKDANLDANQYPPKDVMYSINKWKEEGQRARHIFAEDLRQNQIHLDLYSKYEEVTNAEGLVDFGELLLRSHELWLENEEILAHYRQRFRYILVDEFQDTNGIQFAWIQIAAGKQNAVMAVGDDDQSIYGWRGARIDNVLDFEKKFQDVRVIRLEQNYRSTQSILDAANKLIKHNGNRLGKNLWTQAETGDPIRIFAAQSEFEEARYVVDKCEQWMKKGEFNPSDIGILYRNNHQSRVLEQEFNKRGIPYRIYGGTRFYERMEIRDAVGYMKLIHDVQSDTAFERVVNTPPRGIGTRTKELVRAYAQAQGVSLWDASKRLVKTSDLTARSKLALQRFLETIASMKVAATNAESLEAVASIATDDSGLKDYHGRDTGELGRARRDNLDELVMACAQFVPTTHFLPDGNDESSVRSVPEELQDFLDQAMLDAGEYQATTHDAVNMMTVHSAKGLEFPVVFIVGLEEDLFPHRTAMADSKAEEEERRLAYVGITRSMRKLYLTRAATRARFGEQVMRRVPSRFLRELPTKNVSMIRRSFRPERATSMQKSQHGLSSVDTAVSEFDTRTESALDSNHSKWKIGGKVSHSRFGTGTIVNIRGRERNRVLQIEFSRAGRKWLVAETPHLQEGANS